MGFEKEFLAVERVPAHGWRGIKLSLRSLPKSLPCDSVLSAAVRRAISQRNYGFLLFSHNQMLALDSFLWQISDQEKEKYYNNLCFLGRAAAPGRDSCVSLSV